MINQPKIDRSLTAKNVSERRGKIRFIVLHDTAGSGLHNDTRYLANPGDGRIVSVDFTVERDGSIWQLNPDLSKYCTFHAGRNTRFRGITNGACNHTSIGIEIVQKADLSLSPIYPDEQIQAAAALCAWLCEKFGLEKDDITTHRQIITDGSRTDPRKFPFEGEHGFWAHFHRANGTKQPAALCSHGDEDLNGDGIPDILQRPSVAPANAPKPVNAPKIDIMTAPLPPSPSIPRSDLPSGFAPADPPMPRETKETPAPASTGITDWFKKRWAWLVGAPTTAATFFSGAKDLWTSGHVTGETVSVGVEVFKFCFPYVIYALIAFLIYRAIKEVGRQAAFLLQIWANSQPNLNDIVIVPARDETGDSHKLIC